MVWLWAILCNVGGARPSGWSGGNLGATPAVQAMYMYFTAAYQPILPQAPFRNTSLKVSACCQTVRGTGPFVGSGMACLWENRPIRAHSSPGNSLECALSVSCTGFFFFFYTRELMGKCSCRRGGERTQRRWMDLITLNLKLFHFLHLRQAEGNIHPTCTQSFYFEKKLILQKNICVRLHISPVWRFTTSTHVKCNLSWNNAKTSVNSVQPVMHYMVIFH